MSEMPHDHFERGKIYVESERAKEAVACFLEAINDEPMRPELFAWLARAYNDLERRSEALDAANKALELDYRSILAHRQKGRALIKQGNTEGALDAYSSAIEINPNDANAYLGRGYVHFTVGGFERARDDFLKAFALAPQNEDVLIDLAKVYSVLGHTENELLTQLSLYKDHPNSQFGIYEIAAGDSPQMINVISAINKHLAETLLPKIRSKGQILVEYWPAFILWDVKFEERMIDGTTFRTYHGTYGTGYVCLTSACLYVFSFASLTNQVPMYQPENVLWSVLRSVAGDDDRKEASKVNREWELSGSSIFDVRIKNNHVGFGTTNSLFEISPLFKDRFGNLLTGIKMLVSDRFSGATNGITSRQEHSDSDPIALLKKLAELKDAGIISQDEFEEKKREILSRL